MRTASVHSGSPGCISCSHQICGAVSTAALPSWCAVYMLMGVQSWDGAGKLFASCKKCLGKFWQPAPGKKPKGLSCFGGALPSLLSALMVTSFHMAGSSLASHCQISKMPLFSFWSSAGSVWRMWVSSLGLCFLLVWTPKSWSNWVTIEI